MKQSGKSRCQLSKNLHRWQWGKNNLEHLLLTTFCTIVANICGKIPRYNPALQANARLFWKSTLAYFSHHQWQSKTMFSSHCHQETTEIPTNTTTEETEVFTTTTTTTTTTATTTNTTAEDDFEWEEPTETTIMPITSTPNQPTSTSLNTHLNQKYFIEIETGGMPKRVLWWQNLFR